MDKDQLVIELGRLVVNDNAISSNSWDALAIVVEFDAYGSGISGFAYSQTGAWQSLTPRDPEVLSTAEQLHEAMRAATGKDWRVCVLRIIRATQELKIEFEYDHPEKWAIGPDTLERVAEAARPKE